MSVDPKDILARLNEAFDQSAVCHCGSLCKDHGWGDNHSASWNPCPDSQLVCDAASEITRLRKEVAAFRSLAAQVDKEAALLREVEKAAKNVLANPKGFTRIALDTALKALEAAREG